MALAAEDRRRALFVLAELLATTDASQPAYAAATELYREAAENPVSAESAPGVLAARRARRAGRQRRHGGRDGGFAAAGARRSWRPARPIAPASRQIIDDEERPPQDCATRPSSEHNRMVAAMEEVAAAFNEQVRIFKARG